MNANATVHESIADREVVITRDFAAPAHVLFEAYSTREHLMKWFGPRGWPLTLCDVDFRVGGRFRFAMTGPSGTQNTPFGGTYLEIVPNRRIVFDNTFESPGAETMIMTVTFDEQGDRTTLTIHTLFASVAMKDAHMGAGFIAGVGSSLDQLVDVVTEMHTQEV